MTVILSMKTFQKLEEKLGAESAKEVYELAEAIYEEIEKKFESRLDHFDVLIQDTDKEDYVHKNELMALRRDFNSSLANTKEELMSSLKINLSTIRKSLGGIRFFMLINLVLILTVIGYLVKPLIFNGG